MFIMLTENTKREDHFMRLSKDPKFSVCQFSMRRPQINNHHEPHQLDH